MIIYFTYISFINGVCNGQSYDKSSSKKGKMTIRRTVKRVLDGDTFQTYRKVNGSNYVRLANKNAPERHQFGGAAATAKLKRQIQGKTVTLQPVGRSYSRIVAKVRHNRRLVR